jgi:hypothetical protein
MILPSLWTSKYMALSTVRGILFIILPSLWTSKYMALSTCAWDSVHNSAFPVDQQVHDTQYCAWDSVHDSAFPVDQ